MFHTEVLTPESKTVFPKLAAFKGDFYLAGGTALALQMGHRVSVDFDLFSPNPIKKTLLKKVEELYDAPLELLVNNSRELTLLAGRVKHTFLHYPFPLVLPLEKADPLDLLSAREILATKAYTIGRRGSFKDYIDLYVGLSERVASLPDIMALAREKYGEAFNDRLFLEQLLYLDDVAEEAVVMLLRPIPRKDEIAGFFMKETAALRL